MHNNSYKLNFLHVAYKMAKMPCIYKGVNYLNVNHTFLERTISKRFFDSSELRFWGVFMCISAKYNDIIYIKFTV